MPRFTVDQRLDQRPPPLGASLTSGVAGIVQNERSRRDQESLQEREQLKELRELVSTFPAQKRQAWFDAHKSSEILQKWNSRHPDLAVTPETVINASAEAKSTRALDFQQKKSDIDLGREKELIKFRSDTRVKAGGRGTKTFEKLEVARQYAELLTLINSGQATPQDEALFSAIERQLYGKDPAFAESLKIAVKKNTDVFGRLSVSIEKLMKEANEIAKSYRKFNTRGGARTGPTRRQNPDGFDFSQLPDQPQ